MAEVDFNAVSSFLKTHLSNFTEASQVKFREVQKKIREQFGHGIFMPKLSEMIKEINPNLIKPPRKPSTKRRGRKPGPKPGRKPGRPPGSGKRGPGRPPGSGKRGPGRPKGSTGGGQFLVKLGRKLSFAKNRDRVQSVIDKLVAAGKSLGRLTVYTLNKVRVATKVTIE